MSTKVVPLKEVNDATFANEIMGKGIAIRPTEGKVFSPVNGKVLTIFKTKHSIGMVDENGVEVLIHVGLDTAKLDGKHFVSHIKDNDDIKVGDLLLEFDLAAIEAEGFDSIVPIIITNSETFLDVLPTAKEQVEVQDSLLQIV